MMVIQPEARQQSTANLPSAKYQSGCCTTFAQTLGEMQNSMEQDKALSADQARMVIRMVGAAIIGQFQEVSGWSGAEADNFFARFDMLRSYSDMNPELHAPSTPSRTQHAYRTYQKMAPTPAQSSGPESDTAMKGSQPAQSVSSKTDIHELIDRVAQQMDLPANLVHSVVFAESSYRADAVSPAGAEGLMQLMPSTAQEVGVENTFDPQDNLTGGCRYLKGLLDKYNGDLDHALAAYNWGQGNVDRKGLEQMPLETRNYIAKVKQGLEGQV